MGSSLGNALFQTFGGGGADSVRNRLAGALAAGRMSTNKASARLNNSKADAQDTTNASHKEVLDMFNIGTDRGFAARQGNPQFKQTAEGLTAQYDLAQKKEGIAALLQSNPDIANKFRSGMSGADIRSIGQMLGDKNLSAANVGTANAQTGSFNSLAGQRDALKNQTDNQVKITNEGFARLMADPNITDKVKSMVQILANSPTGSDLEKIINSGKTGENIDAKTNVSKEKKKKITQETLTEVEETKKVTAETKVFNKEIDVLMAKINNWDAKTDTVEANMENFNAEAIAKIKEINSRTKLNDQKKLVMIETVKKVQAATQLFYDRSSALFKGNALSQNQFMKDAVAIYKEAMENDTPVSKDEQGNPGYFSQWPLQEQLTLIAEQSQAFKNLLFPDGSPTANATQAPAPNPLAGALQGQPQAPAPTAATTFQPGSKGKLGRFNYTVKAVQ